MSGVVKNNGMLSMEKPTVLPQHVQGARLYIVRNLCELVTVLYVVSV